MPQTAETLHGKTSKTITMCKKINTASFVMVSEKN